MTEIKGDNLEGLLSPFLRRRRFAAALPFIRGGVLDYGCGVGLLKDAVALEDYVGIDSDEAVLKIARAHNPGCLFVQPNQIDALAGRTFDTIVGLAVIEHLPDPAAFLTKAKSFLALDGRIVLTTPHPAFDWAHGVGARFGIFSHESHDEHQSLMGRAGLIRAAKTAGLRVALYRRFLFGVNQLAVLVDGGRP